MLHKRLQKRHGWTLAERIRKRLVKPQLTMFGASVHRACCKRSLEVLATFFNGIDQKNKFIKKLRICFKKIAKLQKWMKKPEQWELEERLISTLEDEPSKTHKQISRTVPNYWCQRFIRVRYVRRKFEEEQEIIVGHYRRPKNISGN